MGILEVWVRKEGTHSTKVQKGTGARITHRACDLAKPTLVEITREWDSVHLYLWLLRALLTRFNPIPSQNISCFVMFSGETLI